METTLFPQGVIPGFRCCAKTTLIPQRVIVGFRDFIFHDCEYLEVKYQYVKSDLPKANGNQNVKMKPCSN